MRHVPDVHAWSTPGSDDVRSSRIPRRGSDWRLRYAELCHAPLATLRVRYAEYPRNLVQPCDEKQRYVALWMERDDVRRAVSNVVQVGVNEARYGERPSRKLRRRRRRRR